MAPGAGPALSPLTGPEAQRGQDLLKGSACTAPGSPLVLLGRLRAGARGWRMLCWLEPILPWSLLQSAKASSQTALGCGPHHPTLGLTHTWPTQDSGAITDLDL